MIEKLLTDNIAIWASADNGKKSGRGRGSSNGDSVYGIKKLRELILELAVRGKLVPQDPNDEPANELLKRIKFEKTRLIAEGKIKKDKALSSIKDEKKPFELPKGWEWTRFGEVCSYIQRGKGPTYIEKSNYIVVSQKCVRWGGLDLEQARYVDPNTINKYEEVRLLCKNDILWNSTGTGTIGRACCVPELEKNKIFVADSHVTVIRSIFLVNIFLLRWIQSPSVQSTIEGVASGTTNQIELNTSTVVNQLLPLPSISEQHRIVAKIDELMALCDQMETKYINATEAHEKLVTHLLGTLTQSQNSEEFNENWQRIAAHFDILFTTETSIDSLKQTILQLGVMGKLVPQDPNDEPASELLKHIKAEKAKLVAEGKIKKDKPLPPISDGEKPFELPQSWKWTKFGDVYNLEYGDNLPAEKRSNSGEYPVYGSNGVVGSHNICFVHSPCIVVGRKGSAGALNLSLEKGCCVTDVAYYCIPPKNLDLTFSFQLFHTLGLDYLGKGIKPGLNRNEAYELLIAIPPFNEQLRIVSKINELMVLCDRLKTKISGSNILKQKLADVIVKQAVVLQLKE